MYLVYSQSMWHAQYTNINSTYICITIFTLQCECECVFSVENLQNLTDVTGQINVTSQKPKLAKQPNKYLSSRNQSG